MSPNIGIEYGYGQTTRLHTDIRAIGRTGTGNQQLALSRSASTRHRHSLTPSRPVAGTGGTSGNGHEQYDLCVAQTRWRAAGITGLRDRHRTGRPTKADKAYLHELERVLELDPRSLGLPFTIWTLNRLRLYLAEQTGILLSYTRFRALMSREGYRWKEPKHDLSHLQDRPAQETAAQIMDWLKKTSHSTPSPTPSSSLWTKRP